MNKKMFKETISFLMESEQYENFFKICKDEDFDRIREDFFIELEKLTFLGSSGNETRFKEIEDLVIEYLATLEEINFEVGLKFGFLSYEEIKRGALK